VIEAYNGKVFVNSIEGEFSEFIMYLPLIMKEL
jgi:two-component system phosphate regulon sensor histidine kinase PhoR